MNPSSWNHFLLFPHTTPLTLPPKIATNFILPWLDLTAISSSSNSLPPPLPYQIFHVVFRSPPSPPPLTPALIYPVLCIPRPTPFTPSRHVPSLSCSISGFCSSPTALFSMNTAFPPLYPPPLPPTPEFLRFCSEQPAGWVFTTPPQQVRRAPTIYRHTTRVPRTRAWELVGTSLRLSKTARNRQWLYIKSIRNATLTFSASKYKSISPTDLRWSGFIQQYPCSQPTFLSIFNPSGFSSDDGVLLLHLSLLQLQDLVDFGAFQAIG